MTSTNTNNKRGLPKKFTNSKGAYIELCITVNEKDPIYVGICNASEDIGLLKEIFSEVKIVSLAHLAATVASGSIWEHKIMDQKFILDSHASDSSGTFKIWKVGDSKVSRGKRQMLLASAELMIRMALAPYEGQKSPWPGVDNCRFAHVNLLATMDINFRFQ